MTLLNVLKFPDPLLRKKAQPVAVVDDAIRTLVDNMFATMYAENGVGLAAIQVNIPYQIITIDISENKSKPICIINPEIINREGTQFEFEGCLSFPSVFEKVERASKIRLKALNREGAELIIDAEDLLAICIQHEMDHLEGILFVDHLSRLKQERARKKLEKYRRKELI